MISLDAQIEGLLFISTDPITVAQIANRVDATIPEVKEAIIRLKESKNVEDSGVHLLDSEEGLQFVTNPDLYEVLQDSVKERRTDLTKPQLESLTIIAYRGPISQNELEHIRGVNSQAIIRNLLIRGLIVAVDGDLTEEFVVSAKCLQLLGVKAVEELPHYDDFSKDERIDQLLEGLDK